VGQAILSPAWVGQNAPSHGAQMVSTPWREAGDKIACPTAKQANGLLHIQPHGPL